MERSCNVWHDGYVSVEITFEKRDGETEEDHSKALYLVLKSGLARNYLL